MVYCYCWLTIVVPGADHIMLMNIYDLVAYVNTIIFLLLLLPLLSPDAKDYLYDQLKS